MDTAILYYNYDNPDNDFRYIARVYRGDTCMAIKLCKTCAEAYDFIGDVSSIELRNWREIK